MPWASDGGGGWDGVHCVPVVADPDGPGEPCTVEESTHSGVDSCDAHSTCFYVEENLEGECYSHCVGSENNPQCSQPDHVCLNSSDGLLALCSPICSPLLSDCDSDEVCVVPDELFTCAPAAALPGEGAAGDPCEFLNGCNAGLVCVDAAAVGMCDPSLARCCTPACDTSANDCPSPDVCVPWYEPGFAPFGSENVGICLESK